MPDMVLLLMFVHHDCARPDPLLRAAKSAACVQSVGQKLESDLLPLLGHHARRQLEVWCWNSQGRVHTKSTLTESSTDSEHESSCLCYDS